MNPLKWLFNKLSRTRAWVWFAKTILAHLSFRVWGNHKSALDKLEAIESIIANHLDTKTQIAFVCCDRASLVAKLIKLITGDRFTHAGMITTPRNVSHFQAKGMILSNLASIVGVSDDFALVAFTMKPNADETFRLRFQAAFDAHYDFEQVLGGDNLYCSEFIYFLLNGIIEQDLQTRLFQGQLGFAPEDVYKSGVVIFDHNPK
jgi:hypothetical protein